MATVHVRYKVGSRETEYKNVNLDELRRALGTIMSSQAPIVDKLLLDPGETPSTDAGEHIDQWISALVRKPKLVLNERVHCDFYDNWWRNKTPASRVFCLLQAAIKAQEDLNRQAI